MQIILAGDLNATPNEACVVHLRGRGMRNAYEDMSALSETRGEQIHDVEDSHGRLQGG